ncbi:MAG: hypothetical protein BMS9Abin18_1032 [Zetaproteobacteria bacterium]|nr:MAG: hypothetical protein BMS9Abin18_1032 [Zetaproteobacteria bacterium]
MLSGTEVLLLAHGSKSPAYGASCTMFLERWEQSSGIHARLCFLEQCEPLLEDALAEAAVRSRMIAVLPLLLNPGMHMQQDIPERLADFKQHHPEIELYLADGLTDVAVIAEALCDRATGIQADMSSIILLTHGSRQNDTRKNAIRLANMLALRSGTEVDVVFSGNGSPSLKDALAQRADKDAVVIVPHFLFPGLWQRQARTDMDTFRHANPAKELMLAKPLEAHPAILRLLRQQVETGLNSLTSGHS